MRVAFVTGSRADWNGLGMVAKAFKADGRFEVAVVVTGQHLEQQTSDLIWNDGLDAFHVRLGRKGDQPLDIAKAIGTGVGALAGRLATLKPDLVVLLGDRYEIFAAAAAAATLGVPIAHLSGGDVTEGSLDDRYRNAITMLADLHFTTHLEAKRRIGRMQDAPPYRSVFSVGAPALDRIRETPVTVDRAEFCRSVGLAPAVTNILVALHPVTTDADPLEQCRAVETALEHVKADLLILQPNADAGGDRLGKLFQRRHHIRAGNLSAPMFYAALTHMDLMIGNSSAGIYETAWFGIPVVNVGNRQTGRIAPANVLSCRASAPVIAQAAKLQLANGRYVCANPYGDGQSSARIVEIVAKHFGE